MLDWLFWWLVLCVDRKRVQKKTEDGEWDVLCFPVSKGSLCSYNKQPDTFYYYTIVLYVSPKFGASVFVFFV